MSSEIYYFSGTGNSLHVARELQKRIPESILIPIISLLHYDTIKTNADTIGFIFPNFCLTIPIPIHEFLKKVDITSAQYIFAICTRGGSPSEAFGYINTILKKQGKKLNAQLNINMPWNHPLGKENLPVNVNKDKIAKLESEMQKKLDLFYKIILANKEYDKKATDVIYKLPSWVNAFSLLIPKSFNYKSHNYMYQKLVIFYSDSQCNGCGVCEKVCLSNKVKMIDKKPMWKEDVICYACFACINFCPQHSIQIRSKFPIKSYTDVNGRYHHPEVTYKDIALQRSYFK
jgi:ferredoxin